MPRFVLLQHDWPSPHYDLMLEQGNVLQTWRVYDWPPSQSAVKPERIGDHRMMYLHYEGPVSGDRGSVKRVDCGNFSVVAESTTRISVNLMGESFRGVVELPT